MTAIGLFRSTPEGFEGRLQTLTLDIPLIIRAEPPSEHEAVPAFRVFAGEADAMFEVGAGWEHVGDRAGPFVSLILDDPALPFPLRCNLFATGKAAHVLTWTRPSRHRRKA